MGASRLQSTYRCLLPALLLMLLALGTSCRGIKTAVKLPAQAVQAIAPGLQPAMDADPVAAQQDLLRFADEFSARMVLGADELQRSTNALDRAELLRWKIAINTETCAIASGPNAVANLLDMTVFVTTMRMSLEENPRSAIPGLSAQPVLESCRLSETEIWHLAGKAVKAPQLAELHDAIGEWHRQNPLPEAFLTARAVDLASRMTGANQSTSAKSGSVFSLLQVDPLAGLDPAVREVTQTRMFAERALFVLQKMPMLLRWQTELFSLNAAQMPAVQQLVTNSTQIAASVDRFSHLAEQLPGQVSAERAEILKALQAQEQQLAPLVDEVHQTLAAGAQMSTSLNTTLTTFDGLMKRFGVGETNRSGPPATNAEPFRIQDYGQTATRLEAAARQLTTLLVTLNQTIESTNLVNLSAQVGPVVQQAQSSGKDIVDHAFLKAMLLVVVIFLAALLYRWLTTRPMFRVPITKNEP